MITNIYTAEVKLNKNQKNLYKTILIENDNGILVVHPELACSWFPNKNISVIENKQFVAKLEIKDEN